MPRISEVSKTATAIVEKVESGDLDRAIAIKALEKLGEQAKTPGARGAVDAALNTLADMAAPAEAEADDPLAALLASVGEPTPKPAAVKLPTLKAVDLGHGVSAEAVPTYLDKSSGKHIRYSGGPSLRIHVEGQRRYLTIPEALVTPMIQSMFTAEAGERIAASMIAARKVWEALA